MTTSSTSRRGRTRWLLVVPLVGLTVIVIGVVLLERAHPRLETEQLQVEDVPPLGIEGEQQQCIRLADDSVVDSAIEEVRESFPPGGRVSSAQVHSCPAAFDELEVTFVGEVVGELLPRQGGAWAQVNDDPYALEIGPIVGHRQLAGSNSGPSVWLPDGLHERIEAPGRPDRRGDVIAVEGRLLRADPDDGGGITVRAEELEVLAGPVEIQAPLHVLQVVVAAVLALAAIASLAWARRVRRR